MTEPVTIQLEEAPLFMVPGKIHLTFESPGPVEIDPTTFTDEERTWINNAHLLRKVKVVNPNGPAEPVRTVDPKTPAVEQQPIMDKKKDAEIEKIKILLKGHVSTLKKSFAVSKDIQLLRMVKEQEELRPKPRKSLLKTVDDQLKVLQDIVLASVGGQDVGDKLNPVRVGKIDPNFVSDVTDEAEREITIRPATEDDYSDPEVVVE